MNIFDFTAKDRSGNDINLSKYKGKVILIINSATQCGFTPQYDPLQKLYDKYKDQDFVILDFPCNQFGNQAPGTDAEINSFCEMNYGVTFPAFAKIEVNGENAHPLYKYLKSQKSFSGFHMTHSLGPVLDKKLSEVDPNYKNSSDIKWNFTKFLVDREGNLIERFEPTEELSVVEDRIKDFLK